MYRYLVANIRAITVRNTQNYHSGAVFGYRPKIASTYEVSFEELQNRNLQSNFYRLVTAYREFAHLGANINPVQLNKYDGKHPALDATRYGLQMSDTVHYKGILNYSGKEQGTIQEAIDYLNNVYGQKISAEFLYAQTEEERDWFARNMELQSELQIDQNSRVQLATELLKSQTLDNFLAIKFTGLKRYGGEGAESMLAFFSEFLHLSVQDNLEQIVLAMPHRGRLNLLTGMLNMPPGKLFRKLQGLPDFPEKFRATGDVISHLIASSDLEIDNKSIHITMLYNPSHLEAVNPVSMGKTRAKQLHHEEGPYDLNGTQKWGDKIINVQVHGDGALPGQGVNAECLAISGVPHFEIGGSVHLVVNNQVGFTTPGDRGRSSRYCTDIAKSIGAPVIHVNGDDPEMVVKATRIAFDYQRKFRKDVFIDMNCYRQWGHNELDDPTITNPALYSLIRSRKTVPDLYAEQLLAENILTKDQISDIQSSHTEWLNNELKNADSFYPEDPCFKKQWSGFEQAPEAVTTWHTGVDQDLLTFIAIQSVTYPEQFNIHPNILKSHVQSRIAKIADGTKVDWATAEAMAFGSLVHEGHNVRISGQDVGRGTFSHRHMMLVDQKTNSIYIPLNHLEANQRAHVEVANSILSEEAVLGFEYGMSVENPQNLIIWEAQFGDFFNGAQIIFDTFIASGETKWLWSSGLTVLLPHGYDGAGPEHSSCRLERFLQMTDSKEAKVDSDNINMQVVQPSTPAQYFHLLRRQMVRNYRKPLIIVAPKTLLRLSAATSSFDDLKEGTSFLPVIGDPTVIAEDVQKVILSSGRHYYNLVERRNTLAATNTALIRLESFCPFPIIHLQAELDKYPNAKYFVWSQEEPQNMGGWAFVKPRFENLMGRRIRYAGRDTLAAPAVGVAKLHLQQVTELINKPFHLKI